MRLSEYQEKSAGTDVRPDKRDVAYPLLGLAGEVGSLVAEYKKQLRAGFRYEGFRNEVREELGDLLWYMAALCRTLDLDLDDVAAANLEKIGAAWGPDLPPAHQYDQGFPVTEQLPRQFSILFQEQLVSGLPHVSIFLGEQPIGDPLDDNAYYPDNYRFHDALHLAHAAVLGWSPTIRSLLHRKRKSNTIIDRVEDGARSIFLEEGLVAFVFSVAEAEGFFENVSRVDWDLLKTIRRITARLEVSSQPPSAWQAAILTGYEVWRALRDNHGGILRANLDERTLTFVRAT